MSGEVRQAGGQNKSRGRQWGAFEPLVNLDGVLLNVERPEEALAYNQRDHTQPK
jgi:hypothetical protein